MVREKNGLIMAYGGGKHSETLAAIIDLTFILAFGDSADLQPPIYRIACKPIYTAFCSRTAYSAVIITDPTGS